MNIGMTIRKKSLPKPEHDSIAALENPSGEITNGEKAPCSVRPNFEPDKPLSGPAQPAAGLLA
ncbi:hypothetical protein KP014_04765 [Paenibacillus sophorae]|uniref:Uncharacterized protein n=1 Tax=Paenibacillus sophorae TaxID=1333845 RepID=A0ABX8HF78_9BACL|nr:hypothetical protein [Paenibacillus sophorae]QWU16547.1 hypothetical protein KP014_04765 [Paenibacillus sophorae]